MRLKASLQIVFVVAPLLACASTPAVEVTQPPAAQPAPDPRPTLTAGMTNAGVAKWNMELASSQPRPEGFFNPTPGDMMAELMFANSDMAFRGNQLFVGSFRGFQVYDLSNPALPRLSSSFLCPGGQGDVSVHGNLLFFSVEMPNGRVDCKDGQMNMTPSPDRFRGVRVFDLSDPAQPKQVAAVQTCRGSHTHTLVTDPRDAANVYIYVSGASFVRPAEEMAGCSGAAPDQDPNTSLFRIEVIKVPVAAPQNAAIVNMPRIFADSAGNIAGLWPGGRQGEGTQETATTNQCHDITAYPDMGVAAGACSGNGILLDITDPANPKRVEEVFDPNFAYWHSATFNNDASKVLFTDEWGGGMMPRCQATDRPEWGADAIFTLNNRDLELQGYYKLPAAQGKTENCVAHNGNLVPVPGRDIMVQAWYQGGISVVDFTDPKNPLEIAYFDRGPYDANTLHLGGFWSSYWHNGYIYGTEIGRGLDVLTLTTSQHLSANELAAAKLVRFETNNPQTQQRYTFPASFVVAHAYVDQLERAGINVATLRNQLAGAEGETGAARRLALDAANNTVTGVSVSANSVEAKRLQLLSETIRNIK